ncbi:MAG TPA: FAD-dependent oxidoreductase [Dermatophilaceae bacterium]|jgi:D-amino-acid dehydrogenase|nr:FAD-dependent oxidoreductase [Dermatophilaceae bacterium]HRC12719.1 FAD-dependent oxidoreductase [Dermatophilaceae bacterium]
MAAKPTRSGAAPRPSLGPKVVVVGAGVTGAAIAQALAGRGALVTVLDAAPGIGGGCSYANAALLAPSHVGPLSTPSALGDAMRQMFRRPSAVRVHPQPALVPWLSTLGASALSRRVQAAVGDMAQMAERSFALHEGLYAAGLSPTFARIGSVDVYLQRARHTPAVGDSAAGSRAGAGSASASDGPGAETGGLLNATAMRRLEPALGAVAAGSYHPDEAVTESRSFVGSMLESARQHGAEVIFECSVVGVVVEGSRVVGVRTTEGLIEADHVVIASGLGAPRLAGDMGVRLPMRGGRGYVVDLERSAGAPTHAVRLKEHRVVVTPLADRVRVAGYMEFGSEGAPVDPRRSRQLVAVASRALPGLAGLPWLDSWVGERPCLPDGVPALGESGVVAGLHLAVGHGMWGLILAPATGVMIADSVLGGDGTHPIPAAFDPDRFSGAGPRSWWLRSAGKRSVDLPV